MLGDRAGRGVCKDGSAREIFAVNYPEIRFDGLDKALYSLTPRFPDDVAKEKDPYSTLAYSTARVSRITTILICPGYESSVSIFFAISFDRV